MNLYYSIFGLFVYRYGAIYTWVYRIDTHLGHLFFLFLFGYAIVGNKFSYGNEKLNILTTLFSLLVIWFRPFKSRYFFPCFLWNQNTQIFSVHGHLIYEWFSNFGWQIFRLVFFFLSLLILSKHNETTKTHEQILRQSNAYVFSESYHQLFMPNHYQYL